MPGAEISQDRVRKTYGFLVAIESDIPISSAFVETAIGFYMDDDNQYKQYGSSKIDVEALGEIDNYEEETEAPQSPSA